jgi:hypothetical protein
MAVNRLEKLPARASVAEPAPDVANTPLVCYFGKMILPKRSVNRIFDMHSDSGSFPGRKAGMVLAARLRKLVRPRFRES